MIISIASDHAGFDVKTDICNWLSATDDLKIPIHQKSYQTSFQTIDQKFTDFIVNDLGCKDYNRADYPDYAMKVCVDILLNKANFGILICGTGIGMCMVANRFSNIRAALCKDVYTACMAREHNNANVLCIGARNTNDVIPIVKTFLETKFEEEGRHRARIDKFST